MTGYATGNRVQKAVDNDPIDTNGDGEITTADTPAFDVFTNYTFNAGDQLIEEVVTDAVLGTTTHDYDGTQNVGKTEYEPDGSVKSQTRMSYDLQGRLEVTEVSQYSDGVVQSRSRSTYDYDATGIRVAALRQIDADGDGTFESTTDVRFLVDHANHTGYQQVIRESHLDAAGNLIKTIDYTFGHDELHQTVKEIDASTGDITSSRTDFFLHDGHGDVRALLNAAGAVATIAGIEQAFYYDAYGQMVNMAATAAATTLLYSGEQTDALTGQQYLRARYYNPNTGQFNRLDDFFGNHQDPQSFHKYAYVHGDPVNMVDPTGLFGGLVGAIGGLAIGAFNRASGAAANLGAHAYAVGQLTAFRFAMALQARITYNLFALASSNAALWQIYGPAASSVLIADSAQSSFTSARTLIRGETPDGDPLGFYGYGLFATLLAMEFLPGESEEALQAISELLVLKRGTTFGQAIEIVDSQSFDVQRLRRLQEQSTSSQKRGVVFVTTQHNTAYYYADLAGGSGNGMGPAILRIEVPKQRFLDYAAANGIDIEAPVPSPSSGFAETETLLPFDTIEDFEEFATFLLDPNQGLQ